MNDKKLIVCMLAGNTENFIDMAIESVQNADKIIVVYDTTSKDKTNDKIYKWQNKLGEDKLEIIERIYEHQNPKGNGRARNYYLNHIKEFYPNDWCLVIDADEVVEDLNKIKSFIKSSPNGLYSMHMRHFHNDLGHEDSTVGKHYVPNRLFKIRRDLFYPEVEHPVLQHKELNVVDKTDCTTIWHLAHINHVFNIKGRYEKNMKHSNIHSPQFLDDWKDAHMLGRYPNKPVDIQEIPDIILKNFHIDKDKHYFTNRGIEMKHPLQVKQWYDYFEPETILDLGCGRGPYLYFWKWFENIAEGIELSQWAVDHAFTSGISQGQCYHIKKKYDLITAIDLLEHLDDNTLNTTLLNMRLHGNKFIFSIPFVGDPNLLADKTHRQFKTKEEWIKLIEGYGIKIEETPSTWLFKEQILVGRKV